MRHIRNYFAHSHRRSLRAARNRRRSGQAIIETSLMVPMAFFMFIAMFDFGFYIFAFIQVGNAARVAAQHTANSSSKGSAAAACDAATGELLSLPNVSAFMTAKGASAANTNCTAPASPANPSCPAGTCSANPMQVWAHDYSPCQDPFTKATKDGSGNAYPECTQVTVSYETVQLFPLPFMTGIMAISRTSSMVPVPQS